MNLAHLCASIETALGFGFIGVHAKANALLALKHIPAHLHSFYSAHSVLEVQEALEQGAHLVTLSPIFPTPNKPPALGLEYLDRLSPTQKQRVFALGGITHSAQLPLLAHKGIKGFAGIRFFESS